MMTEIIEAMPSLNGMDQQQFAQALIAHARAEGASVDRARWSVDRG